MAQLAPEETGIRLLTKSVPNKSFGIQTGMTFILVVHLALELLSIAVGTEVFAFLARISFCLICLIGLGRAGLREWGLISLGTVLALLSFAAGKGWAPVIRALDLAAYFSAFIVLLTIIQIAAERSGAVERVGVYLTSQSQGRRYFATAIGSHILGAFLNFAAVSLMAPLIQRSAVREGGEKDLQLERRQISAMIRGFSWVIMWAPTTLTMAVIPSLFAEANWWDLLPYGLTGTIVMILLGRACDRFEWRQSPTDPTTVAKPFPQRDFLTLGGICAMLILTSGMVVLVFGLSIAKALMFVAPTITLAWFAGLSTPPGQRAGLSEFGPAVARATPGFISSAMTLGLSGLIGVLAGEVLAATAIVHWIDFSDVPEWLVLAALPVLITLGGQAALSPILVVVFLGELLNSLPVLPADPVHIMFALSAGWALSMTASPNASATLLIAASTRIAPTRLTWGWNLNYAVLCYAAFVGLFVAITALS